MTEGLMAGITWLGAAIIVVSDGRRGLTLGLAAVAGGLGGLALAQGRGITAAVILAGGLGAAVLQLRRGRPGWVVMPPGSTPRLILAVVGGLLALWIGATGGGPDAAPRFATLAVLFCAGARMIQGGDRGPALAAVAALALTIGAAGDSSGGGLLLPVAAALAAAGSGLIPAPVADAG
jgi:hypothetical protein